MKKVMRNLLVDLTAGILITAQAFYDFGTPWCYFFCVFSLVILLGEGYQLYRLKHGKKSLLADDSRSSVIDCIDIGLGIILAYDFYDWLGLSSFAFWLLLVPCVVIIINSIYNLMTSSGDSDNIKGNKRHRFLSIINGLTDL